MRKAFGFAVLFVALQGAATALGSNRGEWGLAVAVIVFAAGWAVQRVLHGEGLPALGVRRELRGSGVGAILALVLVIAAVLYFSTAGGSVTLVAGWPLLALGMLAQGGLAEELVFRGYLFGHLRRGRSFWRAALVSAVPFAAAHLFLFFTMEWPLALAALVLSVALSFPYARLFELAGQTIWAPAILHAVTQAVPKLIVSGDTAFPLFWMAAALVVSWSVFLLPEAMSSEKH